MSTNYFSLHCAFRHILVSTINFLFIFLGISNLAIGQGPSEKRENESAFFSDLINLESTADQVFRYTTTLENNSSNPQVYELITELPKGWYAAFKTRGKQFTSIKVDGGSKETITLELHPSHEAQPSKYSIPVTARSDNESIRLDLEAVISGTHKLEISTPTGRLNGKIIEGQRKEIQLVVKNTASLDLEDVILTSKAPPKWSVVFEPSKIDNLSPGETENVIAILTVPDKTIAGDYMTTFTAKNANTSDQAVFRMSVVTSLTSGLLGGTVILITIAIVYFLIRKYGRR
ncbi:NEW3 domain-containing protein [Flagellimonas olearia]|uniref:Alpha-galactosidase NEW3 domain-containing protein n=1 Tax=Flagellimonas olearia TaxID=552546 RepID=A0A444VRL9_9FLAO|nr:NEW3 domain-containing protein [Allomuricauda olearia]RYC53457.1 hypothetical protein DN53_04380 [Allomuricauda olearia]